MSGAVLALTPHGRKLALLIGSRTGFAVYLPAKLVMPGDSVRPFDSLRDCLEEAFARERQLVLVMAAGIAVRLLAPLLVGKQRDPAVVVLDEGGRHVISLLSGHFGGGNRLARQLASAIGAVPVITTATDTAGLTAVDVLAETFQLLPEPFVRIKEYNCAQLRGETVAVFADGWPPSLEREEGLCFRQRDDYLSLRQQFAWRAVITDLACWPGAEGDLHLRPASLYVGLGCRRGIAAAEVLAAINTVFLKSNLAPASLAALATIEARRDEPGLKQAAKLLGKPLITFSVREIQALEVPYRHSPFVYQNMGVGGVCEPAAILAAGGRLLVEKQKLNGVTVAAARAASPWWDLAQARKGS
ncbi:MAG: Cobalt-precorrin-5A hydrolase [Syntrophomonadaceae bacterium]|nr:Cobalt-precorrin-5A hydrolase [Bacillota bacterium]